MGSEQVIMQVLHTAGVVFDWQWYLISSKTVVEHFQYGGVFMYQQ